MKSVLTLTLLATTALSLACATTDPNKDVKAADAAHAADVRDTNEDTANLEAGQVKDHAGLDSDHVKQDADLDKQIADDAAKYYATREAAEANVVEARRTFRAAANSRLDKVENKASAIDSKHKKSTEPLVAAVRKNAGVAKTALKDLDSTSDNKWFAAMQALDAKLAALEKDVGEIEGTL